MRDLQHQYNLTTYVIAMAGFAKLHAGGKKN